MFDARVELAKVGAPSYFDCGNGHKVCVSDTEHKALCQVSMLTIAYMPFPGSDAWSILRSEAIACSIIWICHAVV